ncbi:c-type cytochrome biogenesis protein CcsB [Paenibacillus selenitireducens]|uniref:C-type cytochrome biogenesis protein CcsB n=1 Tax=Paenibacillus selenitireducens TaxID=1324314 RepID=A0A1T2XNP3_9BACL|nr:cytochrome c biogenesis protein CcsA [Paenibacillus selenitireducens]OPA81405.1 c-type cytochrome biogenesis protein CcsB [Paenibacillus selenitireducens]
MNLLDFSSNAFLAAFFLYCFAFLFYIIAISGKMWSKADPARHLKRWRVIAFATSTIGTLSQIVYFFTRWIGGGHIPTSNMYEFMSFLAMMIMVAFTVVYLIYKTPVLGVFAVPVAILIMAYASVFPQEVQPLVPALDSYWLKIHVTTAATGEAFFAVGFAAGVMYLLRTIDFKSKEKSAVRAQRWVEVTLLSVLIIVGFIASVFTFRAMGYESDFKQTIVTVDSQQQEHSKIEEVKYTLPPLVAPHQSETVKFQSFLGMDKPLFEAPSWLNGANAGRKLNTVIWSVISGLLLYGIIRLIVRKPLGAAIHPVMEGIDPEDLDEISYRAIAIGFPIFTLGALIFAMIWAHIAWSRFWGWDPKEVWALITWLYYSAYLHLRLSRGWTGTKSSWLAVIGFLVVMFTLVGVNLVIAGLHSYAGV